MDKIIELPSVNKGLHFGALSATKDFKGSYFENSDNKSLAARIVEINYKPDEAYSRCDGYFGKCWEASVYDFRENKNKYKKIIYKFRDLSDLIVYYKNEGYTFIDLRY